MTRSKNNSELIVIVTPELVNPVPAGTDIALPKIPQPFLPPNSNTPMHTPDTPAPDQVAAPGTMPVEQLIESMKPEPSLSDGSSGYGASTGGSSGGGSTQQ